VLVALVPRGIVVADMLDMAEAIRVARCLVSLELYPLVSFIHSSPERAVAPVELLPVLFFASTKCKYLVAGTLVSRPHYSVTK
jgi:hypothetical protein